MPLDRALFDHSAAAAADGTSHWNESRVVTAVATVAVLVVALVAILMGMA